MRKISAVIIFMALNTIALAQGLNSTWLLGYNPYPNFLNGRMLIDSNSYTLTDEYRKMKFQGTEATISDSAGNFLMSSNGVWIANANNDTMDGGSGLNPGYFVNSWPDGLLIPYGNIILPLPNNPNKYVLFHQTEVNSNIPHNTLFKTTIDLSLNGGLGKVISKNNTLVIDTVSWGISACKHANGIDWWVVTLVDNSNRIIIMLLDSNGVQIASPQLLNYNIYFRGNVSQITFSQDGKKLIFTNYDNPNQKNSFIILCDFDRCNGVFSNTQMIPVVSNDYIWGEAFSASGNYIYACSSLYVFQINTQTLAVDTVATYDNFYSPHPWCCATTFWNMYLAANGKIYVTTGSSTQHLHLINYPDSAVCDVQQHSIDLVNYLHLRAVPNHPNYYLGCDTSLGCPCLANVGLQENGTNDFRYRVYPNPVTNNFVNVGYILPQNKNGVLKLYDVNGKQLYSQGLPPWSNEQSIKLPKLANGVYNLRIESGDYFNSKNIVVMVE